MSVYQKNKIQVSKEFLCVCICVCVCDFCFALFWFVLFCFNLFVVCYKGEVFEGKDSKVTCLNVWLCACILCFLTHPLSCVQYHSIFTARVVHI